MQNDASRASVQFFFFWGGGSHHRRHGQTHRLLTEALGIRPSQGRHRGGREGGGASRAVSGGGGEGRPDGVLTAPGPKGVRQITRRSEGWGVRWSPHRAGGGRRWPGNQQDSPQALGRWSLALHLLQSDRPRIHRPLTHLSDQTDYNG